MKPVSVLRFLRLALVALLALFCVVRSAPITIIKGTPFLFNKFDYQVDPNRGAQLSPAFQAANGPLGATLVASFGTGKL